MRRPILLLVLCSAFLVTAGSSRAGVSKRLANQVIDEFNQTSRAARSPAELIPLAYVELDSSSYAYALPRRFMRLAGEQERFRIDKAIYRQSAILLRLTSTRGAEVTIALFDNQKLQQVFPDSVLPLVLSDVFDFRRLPTELRYVGNIASHQYHLRGCNHLPPRDERKGFATAQDVGDHEVALFFGPAI